MRVVLALRLEASGLLSSACARGYWRAIQCGRRKVVQGHKLARSEIQAERSSSSAGGTGIGSGGWSTRRRRPPPQPARGVLADGDRGAVVKRAQFDDVQAALRLRTGLEERGVGRDRPVLRAASRHLLLAWRAGAGMAAAVRRRGGAWCAWIRTQCVRRNSRARRLEGSSGKPSPGATGSSMRPLRVVIRGLPGAGRKNLFSVAAA